MGKLAVGIVLAAIGLAVVGLLIRIVAGLFGLMGAVLNTVLGVAVIAALIVIVVWMFRYAAKNRK